MKNTKNVSTFLLVLVFLAPILGTLLTAASHNAETNQYSGLQWAVMGVYNLPFFITSLATFIAGNNFSKKQKLGTSGKFFSVSIVSSLIGTILMLFWGFVGTFS